MQGIKYVFIFLLMLYGSTLMLAQSDAGRLTGEVSYISSQNIYVKFSSTKEISVGDTLFLADSTKAIPVLLVTNKSSISCIGTSLVNFDIEIGTALITGSKSPSATPPQTPKKDTSEISIDFPDREDSNQSEEEESPENQNPETASKKTQNVVGRISAAAYFNFAENPLGNKQRMRYTLSMKANRINNSRFSVETYMSFRHTLNEWDEVQKNFKQAYKVYNLALQYDINNDTRIWAGRKINYSISNIGAIDGLQAEKKWKQMLFGAFVGSRPDIANYGYNPNLFQYGFYAANQMQGKNGMMNTSMALVEQTNLGHTDRRFIYFQHQNALLNRINVFTSFEFDLFTIRNGEPKNTVDMTSLYLSVRYRPSRKLSFFGSYDSRNNVIYYETYKNTIDQLLEDETRKGFRLSFNYRPWKKITIGSNAGYRFQKDNPFASKNMNNYIRVSSVPGIKASLTGSVVLIQSAYLRGTVFGLRLSRDIIKGKLFGQLDVRKVQYLYNNLEFPVDQSILGLNLSWRLTRKLSIAINFEGEFRNKATSSRVYTNIIKRL